MSAPSPDGRTLTGAGGEVKPGIRTPEAYQLSIGK